MDFFEGIWDSLSRLFNYGGDDGPRHESRPPHRESWREPTSFFPKNRPTPVMSRPEIIATIVLVVGLAAGFLFIFTARTVIKGLIASKYELPKNTVLRLVSAFIILVAWMIIRLVFLVPIVLETILLGIACFPKYRSTQKRQSLFGPFTCMDGKVRHGVGVSLAWLFRGCRRVRRPAAPAEQWPVISLQPLQTSRGDQLPPPAYGHHVADSIVMPPPPTYKILAGDDECTLPV